MNYRRERRKGDERLTEPLFSRVSAELAERADLASLKVGEPLCVFVRRAVAARVAAVEGGSDLESAA